MDGDDNPVAALSIYGLAAMPFLLWLAGSDTQAAIFYLATFILTTIFFDGKNGLAVGAVLFPVFLLQPMAFFAGIALGVAKKYMVDFE